MSINSEIHSLALDEFNSGVSFVQGVHSMRHKLNLDKLSDSTIEEAFQRFKLIKNLQKENQAPNECFLLSAFVAYLDLKHMADLTQTSIEINELLNFASCEQKEKLAVYNLTGGQSISIVDHFRGELRDFPIRNIPVNMELSDSVQTKIIGDKYMLQIFETLFPSNTYLFLLKIDIGNSCVEFLDSIQRDSTSHNICLDELNPTRFIVEDLMDKFWVGRVDGDKIIHEQPIRITFRTNFNKLVGNMIYGFSSFHDKGFSLCQQNLLTGEYSIFGEKLPFKIQGGSQSDGRHFIKPWKSIYHWSGDKFFLVGQNNGLFFVHMFDKEKQIWESINVYGFGMAKDLYFDGNSLTIGCIRNESIVQTFRFPLRKPDTLNNIVWFNIKRLSILFKRTIYDDVKDTYKAIQFPLDFNLN